MTDSNKSHITLIVDRTGSMEQIRSDAEGAVNAFISDQKKEPLPCTMLLADFDDQEPFRVVHDGDLNACKIYNLKPRGNTPLLDAIGRGITLTGERLEAMPEDQRPGKVFFVVETDGLENASRDWTLDKVIEAIKRQEQEYNWTFVFLGAGKDAWGQGRQFVGTQMVANSIDYMATPASYAVSHAFNSSNLRAARTGKDVNWAAKVDEHGNIEMEDKSEPNKA